MGARSVLSLLNSKLLPENRALVTGAQEILERAGIDRFASANNLTWAPNAAHSIEYARKVFDRLSAAEAAGGRHRKNASQNGRRNNERDFLMTPIKLLTAAIRSNDPTGIKTLLDQHPELLSETGRPGYAASSGYLEALKALLDCGFTIHDRDKLRPRVSLLDHAGMGGDIRTVKYLIERGCDGKEPGILNGAVSKSVELMQLLILAGADPPQHRRQSTA